MSGESQLLPNSELLGTAKNEISGLRFVLQQNSSVFTENKELSDEMSRNFENLIETTAKKLGLEFPSYAAHQNDYSELGLIAVSFFAAIIQKNLQLKKQKTNHKIQEEELNQLKKNYASLLEEFNNVVQNAKKLSEAVPNADEFVSVKQKLEDSEKRLKIQSQASQEEQDKLNSIVANGKSKIEDSEKEIERLQAEILRLKRSTQSEFSELGKTLGVKAGSAKEVIDGLKQKYQIDDDEKGDEGEQMQTLQDKIEEAQKQYDNLLREFNVPRASSKPKEQIENNIKRKNEREILQNLQKQFGPSAKGNSVNECVENIVGDQKMVLRRIATAFNIPSNLDNDSFVEALKDKFYSRLRQFQKAVNKQPDLALYYGGILEVPPQNVQETTTLAFASPEKAAQSPKRSPPKEREIEPERKSLLQNGSPAQKSTSRSAPQTPEKNVSTYQTEIDNLNDRIQKLVKEKAQLKADLDTYKQKCKNLTENISAKQKSYQKKTDQLAEMINELAEQLQAKKKTNHDLKKKEENNKKTIHNLKKKLDQEKEAKTQLEAEMNNNVSQLTYENEALRRELQNSQMRGSNIETSILNTTVGQSGPTASQANEQSKKMQTLVDEVLKRYNDQSEELQKQANIRQKLIEIVHKQSQLIHMHEQKYEERINQDNEQKEREKREQLEQTLLKQKEETVDPDQFIDLVDNLDFDTNETLNKCLEIAHNYDKPVDQKIQETLSYLINGNNERQAQIDSLLQEKEIRDKDIAEKEKTINHTLDLLAKQTKFIERKLVPQIQSDQLPPLPQQDINDNNNGPINTQQALVKEVDEANKFLHENCTGFVDDVTIFDAIDIHQSPLDFHNSVNKLFETYGNVETNEGRDMLSVLYQSVGVITVLRRYGAEATNHIQRMNNELKRVKRELDSTLSDNQRHIQEIINDYELRLDEIKHSNLNGEEILKSTENILRANITNPDLLIPIMKAFDQLRNGDIIYDLDKDEYNDALAEQLHRTVIENGEKDEELKSFKEKVNQETMEVKQAADAMENETNALLDNQEQLIAKLNAEIEQAQNQFKECSKQLDQAMKEKEELQQKLDQAQKQIKDGQNKVKEGQNKIKELEAIISDVEKVTKDKYKAKLDKTLKGVLDDHQKGIEKLQRRVKSVQKDNQKQLALKDQEIEGLHQQINELCIQKEEIILQCQHREEEAKQAILEMKEKNKEYENAAISSDMQVKVLEQRLKSNEERLLREKEAVETQFKLKEMHKEEEIRNRTSKIADELEKRKQQFLYNFVKELHEFVSSSMPVNEESVLQAIRQIYSQLKLGARYKDKMEDIESQMREIRLILKASKGTRTTACVKDLVDLVAMLREKNAELEKSLKEK